MNWKVAQIVPSVEEEAITEEMNVSELDMIQRPRSRFRCQVDASWTHEDRRTGLGFVLLDDDQKCLLGLQNDCITPSPLHAEAKGLLWAMKRCMSGEADLSVLKRIAYSF